MYIQSISNYNYYPQFTAIKPRKKVPNLAQPHIENSEYDLLPQEIQDIIKHIQENWFKIKTYFDKLKSKQIKATQIRERYQPLIRRSNKQGLTFQNPETDELVTVLQSRSSTNFLRFIIEKGENITHLLVDMPNKLIKNLDPNAPYVIPPKFRYMAQSEIQDSGIHGYAKFSNDEIDKYVEYLDKYDELYPRQKSGPKIGYKRTPKPKTETITPKVEPEIKTYKIEDVLNAFHLKPEELPSHITPTISPRSGQIIGLNLITSNGTTLRISKKMTVEFGTPIRYLSFTEISKDGNKHYLNIDLDTNDFLKTNVMGKPLVDENEGILYYFTSEEAEERGITKLFNKYMNEVFAKNAQSRAKAEAETVIYKQKRARKKQPSIDEIRVEDLEDKRLNRMLDKENSANLD